MKYPPILPKFYEEEPTAFKRLIQAQLSRKDLKDSLNLIPSPSSSVKIQIMGKKVCLRCKGKTLKTKGLLTSPSNVLPLHLKQTFLPII